MQHQDNHEQMLTLMRPRVMLGKAAVHLSAGCRPLQRMHSVKAKAASEMHLVMNALSGHPRTNAYPDDMSDALQTKHHTSLKSESPGPVAANMAVKPHPPSRVCEEYATLTSHKPNSVGNPNKVRHIQDSSRHKCSLRLTTPI